MIKTSQIFCMSTILRRAQHTKPVYSINYKSINNKKKEQLQRGIEEFVQVKYKDAEGTGHVIGNNKEEGHYAAQHGYEHQKKRRRKRRRRRRRLQPLLLPYIHAQLG